MSANSEIARLKQLLAHALKRKEQGTEGGAGISQDEDESLLQENMKLKEENLTLKNIIRNTEGPPHVIERDRRGRVKPVKQRKGDSNISNRHILKPVKSTATYGRHNRQIICVAVHKMQCKLLWAPQ